MLESKIKHLWNIFFWVEHLWNIELKKKKKIEPIKIGQRMERKNMKFNLETSSASSIAIVPNSVHKLCRHIHSQGLKVVKNVGERESGGRYFIERR